MTTPSTSTPEPTGEASLTRLLNYLAEEVDYESNDHLNAAILAKQTWDSIRSSLPTAALSVYREEIKYQTERAEKAEAELAGLRRSLPGGDDLREAARKVCDEATTGSTASDYSQRVGATCSLVPTKLIEALDRALSSLSPVPAAEDVQEALKWADELAEQWDRLMNDKRHDELGNGTDEMGYILSLIAAYRKAREPLSLLVPAPSNPQERK